MSEVEWKTTITKQRTLDVKWEYSSSLTLGLLRKVVADTSELDDDVVIHNSNYSDSYIIGCRNNLRIRIAEEEVLDAHLG